MQLIYRHNSVSLDPVLRETVSPASTAGRVCRKARPIHVNVLIISLVQLVRSRPAADPGCVRTVASVSNISLGPESKQTDSEFIVFSPSLLCSDVTLIHNSYNP